MEEKFAEGDFSGDTVREAAKGLGASLIRPPTSTGHGLPEKPGGDVRDTRYPASRREEKAVMGATPSASRTISLDVNGEAIEYDVPARRLLVHFIRDDLGLTGTHVGCDTGNCGACTIHLDGASVKSRMLLAQPTVPALPRGRRARGRR